MKKYVAYNVTSSRQSGVVDRRYKHFDWLAMRIEEQFPCSLTPKLPAKQSSGRFEEDFIQRRQVKLIEVYDFRVAVMVFNPFCVEQCSMST